MKYIIILSSFLCLLSSCEEEEDSKMKPLFLKFEIENVSGTSVDVQVFKTNNQLFRLFNLKNSESIIADSGLVDAFSQTYMLTTTKLDSAILTFSNGKKLTQTYTNKGFNDTINNILVGDYYMLKSAVGNNRHMIFTISKEDSLRAK